MSEPPILQVRDLCSGYGRSQVLFGVRLEVPRQGAVAILGRNGAGKTTLIKTLLGELKATAGTIRFDDEECAGYPTERRVRAGLGCVPQEHAVFGKLTVRENLQVGALRQRSAASMDRVLAMFPKLGDRLDQQAGTLSGGERKMLAIARALVGEPRLLLLDEPTEGVWVGVIDEITERLVELSASIAIVIVEQHLELALHLAQYAYVMDRGHVALHDRSESLRGDPRLLRYLAP